MSGNSDIFQCKQCGDDFSARVADRKRGWARFCSKSCKAKHQENRTGQYARHKERQREREDAHIEMMLEGSPFSPNPWDRS